MDDKLTLFVNATIITIDPEHTIWVNGAILVQADRIKAIGKAHLFSDLPDGTRTVDCQGKIIIPGLVNTHAHLGQSILRGLAEDVPLHSWLCDAIWPLEAFYDDQDGYIAARVTIAEMLKSGTTCFLEALLTPRSGFDNAARAVEDMGIRACLGKLVKGEDKTATNGLADPRDKDAAHMSIDAALTAHQKYHDTCDGRLQVWMAAVTPRGSHESAHQAIGDACVEHGISLTMHCAEAPKDLDFYRDSYSCSPMQFCKRTNLVGKDHKTVLAHMVNLDLDRDLPILLETKATVAHNPSSNCKLASGIAAVPDMLSKGINVSLGTDGAPCANTYDMIQEMRWASLLQKGSRRNAEIMTAEQVLTMATINGAKALGLEKDIGSLEVGKKADFAIIDPSGLHCAPFDAEQIHQGGLDPLTVVVFSCSGADISMVVVDGRILVEDHKLVHCDEEAIKAQARQTIARVREKSGVKSRLTRNYC